MGVKSCGKCIATSAQCGWCGDQDYDKTNQDRCDLLVNLDVGGCSKENISNPANDLTYILVIFKYNTYFACYYDIGMIRITHVFHALTFGRTLGSG